MCIPLPQKPALSVYQLSHYMYVSLEALYVCAICDLCISMKVHTCASINVPQSNEKLDPAIPVKLMKTVMIRCSAFKSSAEANQPESTLFTSMQRILFSHQKSTLNTDIHTCMHQTQRDSM